MGKELSSLDSIYEEPHFEDEQGKELATNFLTNWRDHGKVDERWLIITGEYGTGKTALTKILQYRWLREYKKNPSIPIPFRIELRDFTRQFNARGLLHHFLDNNSIGHIPVDFVYSLLRAGRIILLLDGYDEMAQYLNVRERRVCLGALAELSSGGAKGILTSRPNYFTETEEFHIFEILYSSLEQQKYYLTKKDRELIEEESQIDELLEEFLDQHERVLKDLTPSQTESLVKRALRSDPHGRDVVLGILKRIFRSVESGEAVSLSGKPVIINYLLEIVEGLKVSDKDEHASTLSEWDVYKMIVDQLMMRDLRRSPEVGPDKRRQFLSHLSIKLSQKDYAVISEEDFKDIVSKEFQGDLRRQPTDQRHQAIERYFADLRGSATLTRSPDSDHPGWTFSHNSLREYLVAEYLLNELNSSLIVRDYVPISDAMRIFVSSLPKETSEKLLRNLRKVWHGRHGSSQGVGQLFTLLWDSLIQLYKNEEDPVKECLLNICSGTIDLSEIEISRIFFSSANQQTNIENSSFTNSTLLSVGFSNVNARGVDFSGAFLDGIMFSETILDDAHFRSAFIVDADFSGASVTNADFSGISKDDIAILVDTMDSSGGKLHLEGLDALGYLCFNGAIIEDIPDYYELKYHPRFAIVEKIIEKLKENTMRQRRGLEQRGAARQDIRFSREFMKHIENKGLIRTPKNRKDLVEVTDKGREVFGNFVEKHDVPEDIAQYLRDRN